MVGLLAAARIFAPWAGVAVLGIGLGWLGDASVAGRAAASSALARGFFLSLASLIVVPLALQLVAWACGLGPGEVASLALFGAAAPKAEHKLALGLFLLPIAGFLIARLVFTTAASLGCAVAIAAASLLLALVSWPVACAGGLAVGALAAFAFDSLGPLAAAVAGAGGLALIVAESVAGRPGLVAVFLALDGGLALALLAARGAGPSLSRLVLLGVLAVMPAFALLALGARAGALSLTEPQPASGVRAGLVFALAVLPGAAAGCGAAALMLSAASRRLLAGMRALPGGRVRHRATLGVMALALFVLGLIVSAALAGLALALALGASAAFAHAGAMAGAAIDPLPLAGLQRLRAAPLAARSWWLLGVAGCIFLPAAARLTLIVNRAIGGGRP